MQDSRLLVIIGVIIDNFTNSEKTVIGALVDEMKTWNMLPAACVEDAFHKNR